jgi:hypothetical protein
MTQNSVGKAPLFQPSIDTQMIEERLRKAPVGDLVTYAELTQLVGRDVREAVYHCLQSARKRLEKDGMLFGTIEGEGLRRLSDSEIVKVPAAATLRQRRMSQRVLRQLACVQDFPALSAQDRVAHNTSMSLHGAIYLMTKPNEVKRLSDRVSEAGEKLATAKTLELFSKS